MITDASTNIDTNTDKNTNKNSITAINHTGTWQTQSVEQRRQWLFCCLSGFYVQYNFELMMEIQIQIQVRIQIQYKYKYSYSNQPHNHWSGAVNGCFAAWAASVYHIIYH